MSQFSDSFGDILEEHLSKLQSSLVPLGGALLLASALMWSALLPIVVASTTIELIKTPHLATSGKIATIGLNSRNMIDRDRWNLQHEDIGSVLLNKLPGNYVETSVEFCQGIKAFETEQPLGKVETNLENAVSYLLKSTPTKEKCHALEFEAARNICLEKLPEEEQIVRQSLDEWIWVGHGLNEICNLKNGRETLDKLLHTDSGTLGLGEDVQFIHKKEAKRGIIAFFIVIVGAISMLIGVSAITKAVFVDNVEDAVEQQGKALEAVVLMSKMADQDIIAGLAASTRSSTLINNAQYLRFQAMATLREMEDKIDRSSFPG
jgi:hypothetical protein